MAPPDTNILRVDILRTVNFDGINNTILFDNKSQRDTYFNSKILYSLNSQQQRVNLSMSGTYQRRQWIMRFNSNYNTIINDSNYMRYKNGNEDWIYCFIVDVMWINPNDCEIAFIVDSVNTYIYDVNWKPCLVEREHSSVETLPSYENENVSFSNYIESSQELYVADDYVTDYGKTFLDMSTVNKNLSNPEYGFIIECSPDFANIEGISAKYTTCINNVYSEWAYVFLTDASHLQLFMAICRANEYNMEEIKNIYSIPNVLLTNLYSTDDSTIASLGTEDIFLEFKSVGASSPQKTVNYYVIHTSRKILEFMGGDTTPVVPVKCDINLNSSIVTNSKCYNSPYMYITLYTPSGKFKIEPQYINGFITNNEEVTLNFNLYWSIFNTSFSLAINPNTYSKITAPQNYNGSMFKVNLSPMPSHNSIIDAQSQWWRENKFSIISNVGLAAASIASGVGAINMPTSIATPQNAKGGTRSNNYRQDYEVMGGAASLLNTVDKIYKASKLPDYENTQLSGIDSVSSRIPPVIVVTSRLITEELQQLNDYFNMFGYFVNKIQIPTLFKNGINKYRRRWEFLKTSLPVIFATKNSKNMLIQKEDIPYANILEIKSILNNGITFWNYSANIDDEFGDYTLENEVI